MTAPLSQHTPQFPGTLPITQTYNQQSVSGSIASQVPSNQIFTNQSFHQPMPPQSGANISTGSSNLGNDSISPMFSNLNRQISPLTTPVAKPPVVASHTSLPQQPQRPSATATAAPTRKTIHSTSLQHQSHQQTSQQTHKNSQFS